MNPVVGRLKFQFQGSLDFMRLYFNLDLWPGIVGNIAFVK
jgi:hypothetical protein